jgi:hypothetical protein
LRLALLGAFVMALGLALFGALVYTLAARGVAADQDRTLRQHAQDAARMLETASDDSLRPHAVPAPVDLVARADVFVEVLDGSGAVISSTGQLHGRPPSLPASFLGSAPAVAPPAQRWAARPTSCASASSAGCAPTIAGDWSWPARRRGRRRTA